MPYSGRRNKTIGQSGEFAVCAQLGKMGLIATPFSGNVPEFDVIVTDENLTCIPLQVKATYGNNTWITGDAGQYSVVDKNENAQTQTVRGPVSPSNPNLIMVYVYLSRRPGDPDRFFVLTKGEMWAIVHEAYDKWLRRHNGKRPRKWDSMHTAIGIADLTEFEDNWDLVRTRLAQAG